MRIGKITLRDEEGNELDQPYAHGPITADLTDPDGGVTGVMPGSGKGPKTIRPPAMTPLLIVPPATSETYTPTNGDTGFFLKRDGDVHGWS